MKKDLKLFVFGLWIISLCSCGVYKSVNHLPDTHSYALEIPKIQKINDSTSQFQNNYLTKNQYQLWELSLQGNPLQLGYNNGALMQGLMQNQEKIFFSKVEEFVPSKTKQWLLRNLLKWYNRKMFLNVKEEFQAEIYGLSQYSSNEYDFIAPKFLRSMYLHGAHDIGHAMQDLMMVGCSSIAVWDENSEDGLLLIGRNFDFYVGEDFAKNKVIEMVQPENGIPYISVTWPGMIGVVSGMNKEGLTVTINAGKSKIPLTAKTPISLVIREILQYAKNIDEAIAIAKKRKVFVSESIMVGSANDRKAVLIEMSPDNFGVFDVKNSSSLICTNHFQSNAYQNDSRNQKHIVESHSQYRYEKLQEILQEDKQLNPEKMASLLRNQTGLNGKNIGLGNEKSLNQLLAHHAVIFSPEKKKIWVSANPYQLGEFVCYDLNRVFSEDANGVLADATCTMPKDSFVDSQAFKNYEEYKKMTPEILNAIDEKKILSYEQLQHYIALNPEFWASYYWIGKYYFEHKRFTESIPYFETALTKEITTIPDQDNVIRLLKKAKKRAK